MQALAAQLADVFIFVVTSMSLADQAYLKTLRSSRGERPLIVAHNFMNTDDVDDMDKTWEV